MKKNILFFILLFRFAIVNAQHEFDHNCHDHHDNEIGIANAPVYFLKEKTVAYGLHLHYVNYIYKNKIGLGLGFEHIFDEHNHTTIGLVTAFQPINRLMVNLSPGIVFEKGQTKDLNFAIHLESSYEFEYRNLHYGPLFEFAYDEEDIHMSIGLHIGIGF